MIEKKLKICDECGKPSYIWAHRGKKRYCKPCTFKLQPLKQFKPLLKSDLSVLSDENKKTIELYEGGHKANQALKKVFRPIPNRSEKRKKEDVAYQALRKAYLLTHPSCELNIQGVCSGEPAHEIHHTYSGKDREKYFLDTTTWKSTERNCHDWVHLHPVEAREMGLLK